MAGSRHEFCPTWRLLVRLCPGSEGGPRVTLALESVAPLVRGSSAISCQEYVSRTYSSQPYLDMQLSGLVAIGPYHRYYPITGVTCLC